MLTTHVVVLDPKLSMEEKLQEVLSEVGLANFRPLQRDAITSVLKKQDTVVIVATGVVHASCLL